MSFCGVEMVRPVCVGDLERGRGGESCVVPFLRWALRLVSPVIIFFLFLVVLPCSCPFVGVICGTSLLSAVTSLIVHPLSFSFEGQDKVVQSSLFLEGGWRRHEVHARLLLSAQPVGRRASH